MSEHGPGPQGPPAVTHGGLAGDAPSGEVLELPDGPGQALSAAWGGQAIKAEGLEGLSGPRKPGRELESSRNMGVGGGVGKMLTGQSILLQMLCTQEATLALELARCGQEPPPRVPQRVPSPRPEGDAGTQGDPGAVNRKDPPGGLLCPEEVRSH